MRRGEGGEKGKRRYIWRGKERDGGRDRERGEEEMNEGEDRGREGGRGHLNRKRTTAMTIQRRTTSRA